jgi:histidyl-tRNA synthetase
MVSNEIRNLVKGIVVDTSLSAKTTSAGVEFASKKNFDFVVILGKDEIDKNTVTIKKLSDGSQFNLSLHSLISYLQKQPPHENS